MPLKKTFKYTEASILSNFNQMFIIYALEKVVFTSINERVSATAEAGSQRSFQKNYNNINKYIVR